MSAGSSLLKLQGFELSFKVLVGVAQEDLEFANKLHVGLGLVLRVESSILPALVLSKLHPQAQGQIVALLGVAEVALHVLSPESQSCIVQAPEPIVFHQVLFARKKFVEIEPPQLDTSVMGLHVFDDLNLLRMAPAA